MPSRYSLERAAAEADWRRSPAVGFGSLANTKRRGPMRGNTVEPCASAEPNPVSGAAAKRLRGMATLDRTCARAVESVYKSCVTTHRIRFVLSIASLIAGLGSSLAAAQIE